MKLPSLTSIWKDTEPQYASFKARLEDSRGHVGWVGGGERWACFTMDAATLDTMSASSKNEFGYRLTALFSDLSRRSAANSEQKRNASALATMTACRIWAVNHVVPTELTGALATAPDMTWYRSNPTWSRLYVFGVRLDMSKSRQEEEVDELLAAFGQFGRRMTSEEADQLESGLFGSGGDYESQLSFSQDKVTLHGEPNEHLVLATLASLDLLAPNSTPGSITDYQSPPESAFTMLNALRSGARMVWASFILEPAKITFNEATARVRKAREAVADAESKADLGRGNVKALQAAQQDLELRESIVGLINPTGEPYLGRLRITGAWRVAENADSAEFVRRLSRDMTGTWSVAIGRQLDAFFSAQPCGPEAPGRSHHIRADYLGTSRLFSISKGGDASGIHVGYSKADRQPVRLDPYGTKRSEPPLWMILAGTGGGKRLALDTKIPTPSGWTTVGDLKVGDTLFGPDGKTTTIQLLSPIEENPDLYEVVLDDGQIIAADAEHLWEVSSHKHRDTYEVKTTAELLQKVRVHDRSNWSIRVPAAIDTPTSDLPIDPYILGVWLGDGCNQAGSIASGPEDLDHMVARLEARWPGVVRVETVKSGFRIWLARTSACPRDCLDAGLYDSGCCKGCAAKGWSKESVTNATLRVRLRDLGLLGNKSIPESYLFASVEQRMALLQGLMDTDGAISTLGNSEISLSDEKLANDVMSLIRSLGMKAWRSIGKAGYKTADGTYVPCKPRHRISITTSLPIFTLPRKLERIPATVQAKVDRLYIQEIRAIAPRPARCLQVDNDSHLFLCADFVPTHNTHCAQMMVRMLWRLGTKTIFINLKGEGDTRAKAFKPMNAKIITISELDEQDGPLDPFRANFQHHLPLSERMFSPEEVMISARGWVTTALFANLPSDERDAFEHQLTASFKAAADDGATCLTQAMDNKYWAQNAQSTSIQQRVLQSMNLAVSEAVVRVCVGRFPLASGETSATDSAFSSPVTLIEPGTVQMTGDSKCAALLVMVLTQAGIALRATVQNPNGGVCYVDEAHVITRLEATRKLLEARLRIYRSHLVTIALMSQRPEDMTGFGDFSRATMVGFFTDDSEGRKQGRAALEAISVDEARDLSRFGSRVEPDGTIVPSTWLLKAFGQEPVELVCETPPEWNAQFKASGVN